jgi:3-oxoacyl-[acyl-carrier-protein] synthase-3
MAFFNIPNIRINGISSVVPKKVVHNKDYEYVTEVERNFLIKTTGIEEKRHAESGITTTDLGEKAANELLDKLGWKKEDIDILVLVTQSRDYYLPSSAIILQDRLGLPTSCMAFDIGLGCSGYVYGLSVVAQFLQNGQLRKGLLISGDVSTISTNYEDKSTYPLFGDAATATAISFEDGAEGIPFNLENDGKGYDSIIIRDGGAKNQLNDETTVLKNYGPGINHTAKDLELNGLDVFSFSIKEPPKNITQLLENSNQSKEAIDYFIFHQANKLIIDTIRKKLKIAPEKVPFSLTKYGNTSSASIPLTICDQLSEDSKNKKMLFCGFGVGLSWGSCIINTKDIVCLTPIEF